MYSIKFRSIDLPKTHVFRHAANKIFSEGSYSIYKKDITTIGFTQTYTRYVHLCSLPWLFLRTAWWYPCSSWSSGIQGVLRIKTCKLKLSYTTCVSNSRYMVHVTKSSLCSLQCSSVEFWVVYGITRVQFVEQLNCTSGSRRRWLTGWILLPNDNDKWFSYTG